MEIVVPDLLSRAILEGVETRVNCILESIQNDIWYNRMVKEFEGEEECVTNNTTAGNLNRILLLQKRAVRIMSGLGPKESCRDAFPHQGVIMIIGIYIREVIVHIDKEQLELGHDFHTYNTRHVSNFHLPLHHTALFERKTSYMGRKIFNHLPEDMKMLQGQILKNSQTKWLSTCPFYTMDEFMYWKREEQYSQ
ncbi:hypothetical protein J6590_063219 [Homalodisca vitripennis]|nr:hypothetical protein J6590_063219 [Homalodisca vitripennis]